LPHSFKKPTGDPALNLAVLGYAFTQNIGDPVQAHALMELLGTKEVEIVDRDRVSDFSPKDETRLIANGWLMGNADFLEIKDQVYLQGISVHISGWPYFGRTRQLLSSEATETHFLREFRKAGVVGARDLHTLGELRKNHIPSYFSGCLTLAFDEREFHKEIDVLCIDVEPDVVDHIQKNLRRQVEVSTNALPIGSQRFMSVQQISDVSEAYLEQISSATVVITSRLHAALPAISQGVPVIFAPQNRFDPRFSGYSSLFPYIVNGSDLKFYVEALLESADAARPDVDQIRECIRSNVASLTLAHRKMDTIDFEPLPLKFTVSEKESLMASEEDYVKASHSVLNDFETTFVFIEEIVSQRDELVRQRDELVRQRDELESSISWRVLMAIRKIFGLLKPGG